MTIKDFARLCGCNPQTLRYYDRVNLLKPVKVDAWSGYRFYEKGQALTFVKIKNLQRAGFTIGEIRNLLDQDDHVVYEAFHVKIVEQEEKLREIKLIQKQYQSEMNQMKRTMQAVREKVTHAMLVFDATEEFGIDEASYKSIASQARELFDDMISTTNGDDVGQALCGKESVEIDDSLEFDDEIIYEKHGWAYVRDFLDEFVDIEDGGEYTLRFEVIQEKDNRAAFANAVLGILLDRNRGKEKKLSCSVHFSKDGENHFWLLRRTPIVEYEFELEENVMISDGM